MTSKHTPGPWRIHSDYIESDTGYEVCQVKTNHPRNADTQAANARLIAAAPDLLKACQSAERHGLLPEFTCDKLRAAIAKATGGAD